jgi:hypothetical protein
MADGQSECRRSTPAGAEAKRISPHPRSKTKTEKGGVRCRIQQVVPSILQSHWLETHLLAIRTERSSLVTRCSGGSDICSVVFTLLVLSNALDK